MSRHWSRSWLDKRRACALALVGYNVRSRKSEWMKSTVQDQNVLDLGNKASHDGSIVADVALFDDLGLGKTPSIVYFEYIDGMTVEFVRERLECEGLLEMLNWCCNMMGILKGLFEFSEFTGLLHPFTKKIRSESWSVLSIN